MKIVALAVAAAIAASLVLAANVPEQINYQAKIEANGVPFDGVGHFKFAIVDHGGTNTYWSNDGTSTNGTEPTAAVSLNVHGGLLNTMLGDASHANMTPIQAMTFSHPDAHIRMWFGGADGTTFEHLLPDKALGSVPYALMAQTVPDRSLTGQKLARESVWPEHEGRNDCIVTYFAEYTGGNVGTNIVIATNVNYIITDVVFGGLTINQGWQESCADVDIRYTKNGKQKVLFRQRNITLSQGTDNAVTVDPVAVTLRSGLVVPAGATLQIGGAGICGTAKSCTVSGFEIPVE
jgi:hypothetical protein